MAQTKRKRRRKHRGTQGGSIDRRPARGRARTRAEAKARARSRSSKKKPGERVPAPPRWTTAFYKGAVASVLFLVLLAVLGQSLVASLFVAILMMGFYVPLAYLMDRFFHQRFLRKEEEKRLDQERQRSGQQQAPS
jgi:Flp pilus assembly protein TadB